MALVTVHYNFVGPSTANFNNYIPGGATVLAATATGGVDVQVESAYQDDVTAYMTSLGFTGPTTPVNPTRTPVTASGTITTTSLTDVLATGMTDTPPAGTYLVFFTNSTYMVTTGSGYYVATSIWAAGAQNAASQLHAADSTDYDTPATCVAFVTVNGSQAIEGRWRRSNTGCGTAYMVGRRTLSMMKVA